jgi:hypothetical protein
VSSSSEAERRELVRQEFARLATLETRIRTRDAAEPEKMQHRLGALEGMRERFARLPGA